MRKLVYFLLIPFIAFLGCDDDDDGYPLENYRVDIATVENPQNNSYFYLVRDDGVRLWVSVTNYPSYRPKTGQRILADYTLLTDRPAGSSYDHDVRLNDAYNILTKDIVELTPSNEAQIGNDRIGVHKMWIGSDYLNIRFYYGGYNRTHFINLVKDESKEYTDGKVHLEFRHNAYGDPSTYRYNGIVSFNLQSLIEDMIVNSSELELVIHVREFDNDDRKFELTYKFDEENDDSEDFDREDFSYNKDNDIE